MPIHMPNAMKVEPYKAYLEALSGIPVGGRMMPYNWAEFPRPVLPMFFVYSQFLEEFPRELANSINALTVNVHKLTAWAEVLSGMSEDRRFEIAHEFIEDLATNSLFLPYVIKSRFAFSIAHLSHQANRTWQSGWKDDLDLDAAIYLNAADVRASHWRAYPKLKASVESVNGKAFKTSTCDFRNAYNHRFSPRFEFGVTQIVTRTVNKDTGRICYGIGGTPPLQIRTVAELLGRERDRCYVAFERFQRLIAEQTNAISEFRARS